MPPLRLPLVCHPDTPVAGHALQVAISVTISRAQDGALILAYRHHGDPARLRLPAPEPATRADGLWRHTCCEAFIAGADAPAYREFNLAPSGQWQAYGFRGYRDGGGELEMAAPPGIQCRVAPDGFTLEARLPAACLPPGSRLRLGLSVVLEDAAGGFSYWALRHAPGRPDFHHTDAFALELDL